MTTQTGLGVAEKGLAGPKSIPARGTPRNDDPGPPPIDSPRQAGGESGLLGAVAWNGIVNRQARSARRLQRLGGLLSLLLLTQWTFLTWHEATTLHRVCPSHGELLDVELSGPLDRQEPGEGPGASSKLTQAGDADEATHDHCPFVALDQPRTLVAAPIPEAPPTLVAPAPRRHAPAPRAQGIPLFLLAPKQSPPA